MSTMKGPNNPNLNLQHSRVTSGGNTNILNITNNQAPEVNTYYSILEKNIVLDALYNSSTRYDPPRCHPDTRKAVLHHIRSWATSDDSQPVMWIRGGAGAGKSAIAQTLSEGWAKEGMLAASFYFFRTAGGRNEKRYFIATLAYQMSLSIPGCRRLMEEAIRRQPRIFELNLRTQMQELIINPLVILSERASFKAELVVIDGLDECRRNYADQDFEQQQKEILEAIHLASSEKGFPLRFLIASRPERQIREIFDHGILKPVSSRTVLDDSQDPSADIELYLRCRLGEIRQIHPYLGPSWPPEAVIKELVNKASGHFIYVAVVVRYLSLPRTDPEGGLEALMNIVHSNVDRPFAELDALYTLILESVAPRSLSMVMDIFGLMIYEDVSGDNLQVFTNSIRRMSPYFIAKYLFMSPGQLSVHLIDLHSILDIPSSVESKTAPISFLHASFSEFLTLSSRSGRFFVDRERASSRILSNSIRHLLIQILSPYQKPNGEYEPLGFAFLVSRGLTDIEPDNDSLKALRAILSQDKDECVQYVHNARLSHFGTEKRNMNPIRALYWPKHYGSPTKPTVLVTLKRHPVEGFLPIDPAHDDMWPESYGGVLDWFCDASQETGSRLLTHHQSEESHSIDVHPTISPGEHGDILPSGSQGEPENPQPRRSKRRLTLESWISSSSIKPKKSQRRH